MAVRRILVCYPKHRFYWERFAEAISRLQTYQETVDFLNHASKKSVYARYHVNLAVLVYTGSISERATWEEIQLYILLVRRWKANSKGFFPPGLLDELETALMARHAY